MDEQRRTLQAKIDIARQLLARLTSLKVDGEGVARAGVARARVAAGVARAGLAGGAQLPAGELKIEAGGAKQTAKCSRRREMFAPVLASRAWSATPAELETELAGIEFNYVLATAPYVIQAGSESRRAAARDEFARVVESEGFGVRLDDLIARARATAAALGVPLRRDDGKLEGASGAARRAPAGRARETRRRAGGKLVPRIASPDAAPAATSAKRTAAVPLKTAAPNNTERKDDGAAEDAKTDKARRTGKLSKTTGEIQKLLDTYPGGIAEGAREVAVGPEFKNCPICEVEMSINSDESELRCLECGFVREIVGAVFDDSQFYCQEGQKAKSGTFNPNRHLGFWWQHIRACEPREEIGDESDPDNLYGEKLIEAMHALIKRDKRILRLTTVPQIREMLRELKKTDFNKNTALIKSLLTGVPPPNIPDEVGLQVETIFTKVIMFASNGVERAGRVNRDYYPYYIMKILELLIPEDDKELARIFQYIYLQGAETVVNADNNWEVICLGVGLDYRPTDRSLFT